MRDARQDDRKEQESWKCKQTLKDIFKKNGQMEENGMKENKN